MVKERRERRFGTSPVPAMNTFAVALLCAAAATQPAHAQSSVTLYGVVDEGIDYVNNSGGHSLVRMRDGTWDGVFGSRFGLKGSEDLGGGLKAVFRLESGFDATNGESLQAGRLFGRSAYVGLSQDAYGTLTFGRQYDLVVDYLQPVTSNGQFTGPFVHAGDIDNTANSYRIDNAVKYASPTIGGFSVSGMYAFSGSTQVSTTAMWSVAASYHQGGLNAAAVYDRVNRPASFINDGNFIGNTTGAAIGASGAFSYVGDPRNQQIVGAGASYAMGKATAGFAFTDTRFDDANGTTASVRFDNYDVWLRYDITPATTVGGYDGRHRLVASARAIATGRAPDICGGSSSRPANSAAAWRVRGCAADRPELAAPAAPGCVRRDAGSPTTRRHPR